MRCRRQYGETASFGSDLACRRGDVRHLWRLRLCPRVRHRAQVARGAPLPDRPDLDQFDPRLYRPARAEDAALLLSGRQYCYAVRRLRMKRPYNAEPRSIRVPGSETGTGGSPKAMLSTSNPKFAVLRTTSS